MEEKIYLLLLDDLRYIIPYLSLVFFFYLFLICTSVSVLTKISLLWFMTCGPFNSFLHPSSCYTSTEFSLFFVSGDPNTYRMQKQGTILELDNLGYQLDQPLDLNRFYFRFEAYVMIIDSQTYLKSFSSEFSGNINDRGARQSITKRMCSPAVINAISFSMGFY